MSITLRIRGAKDIDRYLQQLEPRVQKVLIKKALRQAGRIVVTDAKRNAPKGESGELLRSIKVRARKRSRKYRNSVGISVVVGADMREGSAPWYAKFQELGSKFITQDRFLRNALYLSANRIREIFVWVLRAELKKKVGITHGFEKATKGKPTITQGDVLRELDAAKWKFKPQQMTNAQIQRALKGRSTAWGQAF